MTFLNIAPVSTAPQATARDTAGGAASAPGTAGKLFELPSVQPEEASLDAPAAGATDLEVSSLASGAHEDKASPTPSSSELPELPAIPEAIAEALPSREDAVAEVDSRFALRRAGDKSALRAAPPVGELLPFFSASQSGPHGVAMPATAADPEPALATDDKAELDDPETVDTVVAASATVLLEALPEATRVPPPATANPLLDYASLAPGATAEGVVVSATPPAPQAVSDHGPDSSVEVSPHTRVEGAAASSAGPIDSQASGQPVAARPVPRSPAAMNEAGALPATPPASAPPLPPQAAAGRVGNGLADQVTTSSRPATAGVESEDAEAPADSTLADAPSVSRFEPVSPDAKKNRGRRHAAAAEAPSELNLGAGDLRPSSARSLPGPVRDLLEDEAHRTVALMPPPERQTPAPEAPLPFTQSLARATQDLAATPAASSSAPGAETAPPVRDAENPAASAPRSLDLRSQAWREHLLESARIRLPAFGAPGNVQTVTLQLHPRLMGALTVTLALTASGGVQMKLGAQNDRARRFFHGEAPAIAASLARGGLNVSSIEILAPEHDTALA